MRTQFNAALLLTLGALSAAPALAETGTIQPAGPRTGSNGLAFFNIEGSGNNANASYGIARFDVSGAKAAFDAKFGAGNYTLTDVALNLTQSNAVFSVSGGLNFAFTPDNTTNITSRTYSPYKFPSPAPTQELITTGTYTVNNTGVVVDTFDLFNATTGSVDLRNDILTNSLATLVVNPNDAAVAATYGGGTNFTKFPVLNITATGVNGGSATFGALSAVPEPSALAFALVGVPGVALFLRRRKK